MKTFLGGLALAMTLAWLNGIADRPASACVLVPRFDAFPVANQPCSAVCAKHLND